MHLDNNNKLPMYYKLDLDAFNANPAVQRVAQRKYTENDIQPCQAKNLSDTKINEPCTEEVNNRQA